MSNLRLYIPFFLHLWQANLKSDIYLNIGRFFPFARFCVPVSSAWFLCDHRVRHSVYVYFLSSEIFRKNLYFLLVPAKKSLVSITHLHSHRNQVNHIAVELIISLALFLHPCHIIITHCWQFQRRFLSIHGYSHLLPSFVRSHVQCSHPCRTLRLISQINSSFFQVSCDVFQSRITMISDDLTSLISINMALSSFFIHVRTMLASFDSGFVDWLFTYFYSFCIVRKALNFTLYES